MSSLRPAAVFVGLLVTLTVLAGCLGGGGDDPGPVVDPPVDLGAFVSPILLDHDHSDEALHGLSWNMERVGGFLLPAGQRGYAAPHALDIKAGKLFVSAYAATADRVGGVYIYDLMADPENPTFLGDWIIPGGAAGDRNMEATADGRFIVVSFEAQDCAGNLHPFQPGMYLIDASDPADPQEVDYVLITPGETATADQHSITIYSTNETDYVFHGGGDKRLYEIDRDTKTFVPVGAFASGHDSSVFWDPVTEKPLLLSADVSALNIYDLSDPTAPAVLGTWKVPRPETYYVHTAVAEHLGGRNIAIVNSEDFRQDPSAFWVLDITDPAAPEVLANWTTPDDVPSGDLTFSLHNPRIEGGIVTFSYYHAGIWQFDLNDPASWSAPSPRAYYLPAGPVGRAAAPDAAPIMAKVCGTLLDGATRIPGTGPTGGSLDILLDAIPFTFDVEVQDGIVYAADVNTGIHVLRFAPGAEAEADGGAHH